MSVDLWLRAVARALLLPPGGPLLLALAGLCLWRRAPRLGRALGFAGLGILLALSFPAVASLLSVASQRYAPLDPARLPPAALIVVLGGGVDRNSDDPAGPPPTAATLERLAYAARLSRATGLPLLLSGGSLGPGEAEAVAMQRALRADFGLEARWLETHSRTTQENAEQSAALLAPLGLRHLILVTSAGHMRRAVAEFQRAGLDPIAAPAPGTRRTRLGVAGFLPSGAALERSCAAIYELAGETVAVLAGRR